MDFIIEPYKVYVKTDTENRIIAINSSAFIKDLNNWIEIDSGYSYKYHHAQNNYLNKPLVEYRGIYIYKLVEGKPMERTQEEIDADYVPPEIKPTAEERITELEQAFNMLFEGATE